MEDYEPIRTQDSDSDDGSGCDVETKDHDDFYHLETDLKFLTGANLQE